MIRALCLVPALLLTACGDDLPPLAEFPALPDLPAEATAPCPPAEQLTGGYADLVAKDARLATEYALCRARAATAVGAYQDAQRAMREAAQKAKQARDAAKPR